MTRHDVWQTRTMHVEKLLIEMERLDWLVSFRTLTIDLSRSLEILPSARLNVKTIK